MEYTFTVANFEEESSELPSARSGRFLRRLVQSLQDDGSYRGKAGRSLRGKVKVGKINVDENMTIARSTAWQAFRIL